MRSRILTSRFREQVLVSCKNGRVFSGVLYSADRQVVVLRSAEVLSAGDNGAPLPVDGEIILFVADVDYMQRPA